ncbi:hypothetical protein [Burkholderia ubonensis]|uniref:hypothetical protein n=1 Tax=Burkholderia ubonensis TaxID=101571 RepID=UPI0012F7A62D|nr:hypothetical protein [Burkholderia ubonensis]
MGDTMKHLVEINEKVAFMSKQLLNALGSRESNVQAKLYETMIGARTLGTLLSIGYKPTPISIFMADTFVGCAALLGKSIKVVKNSDFITASGGEIDANHLKVVEKDFVELKSRILKIVQDADLTVDDLSKIEGQTPARHTS